MVAGSPRSAKTRGQQATMVEDERASVRKRPKSAKAAAKRVRFADEFGVELPPFSEEVPGPAAESPGGAERRASNREFDRPRSSICARVAAARPSPRK